MACVHPAMLQFLQMLAASTTGEGGARVEEGSERGVWGGNRHGADERGGDGREIIVAQSDLGGVAMKLELEYGGALLQHSG